MNPPLPIAAHPSLPAACGGGGRRIRRHRAIAFAVRLLLAAAGATAARGFEVSGFSFTDLHLGGSQSSPPSRSYQSRSNTPARPPPPRETFHAFTPAELARQQAANVARYRQALAQLKPVPPATPEPAAPPTPYVDLAQMMLADTVLAIGLPVVDLMAKVIPPSPPAPSPGPASATAAGAGPLVRIGGVGAARGDVYMVVPGGSQRIRLKPGTPVFANCRLTTGPDARVQILLVDETVFIVGPDSDMVMDDFVYDPQTSTGKIAVNLAKGVFRFVTAKIARQRPDGMKVKVPTGTIGIRGTEFQVSLDDAAGHGTVRLYYGKLDIADQRTGTTTAVTSGQKLRLDPENDPSPPESLDANPSAGELAAAGNALYLRRAAASAGGADDRAFLTQQAGFALAGGAVPVAIPAGAVSPDEAQSYLAAESDVEVKTAACAHFARLRQSLEEDHADATDAASAEQDAKSALQGAETALRTVIEGPPAAPAS